jgi:hypothetical protein
VRFCFAIEVTLVVKEDQVVTQALEYCEHKEELAKTRKTPFPKQVVGYQSSQYKNRASEDVSQIH